MRLSIVLLCGALCFARPAEDKLVDAVNKAAQKSRDDNKAYAVSLDKLTAYCKSKDLVVGPLTTMLGCIAPPPHQAPPSAPSASPTPAQASK